MDRLDLYRCDVCGNIVEIFVAGGGELICCGQPMRKLEPKTNEKEMMEKHVPVFVKREDGKTEIRVGEVLHPMNENHYIMFIETISQDKKCAHVKFLHPGEQPTDVLNETKDNIKAREFCNLHGLWEADND